MFAPDNASTRDDDCVGGPADLEAKTNGDNFNANASENDHRTRVTKVCLSVDSVGGATECCCPQSVRSQWRANSVQRPQSVLCDCSNTQQEPSRRSQPQQQHH